MPAEHGIITNSWLSKTGKEIDCDEDSQERAGVFGVTDPKAPGRSPSKIMVDNLSDQLIPCSAGTVPVLKDVCPVAVSGHA